MNRTTRIVVMAFGAALLAAALAKIATAFGSVVWLSFLLAGVATDVYSGPWWTDAAIYGPTALVYLGALALGIVWVRQAPLEHRSERAATAQRHAHPRHARE